MKHADTLTRHGTLVKKTISFDGASEVRVEMPFGLGDVEWFQRFQMAVPEILIDEWLMADAITITYEKKYRDPFCEYLAYTFSDEYDAPFIASYRLERAVLGSELGFDRVTKVTRFRSVVHTRNHVRSPLREHLLHDCSKNCGLHGEL